MMISCSRAGTITAICLDRRAAIKTILMKQLDMHGRVKLLWVAGHDRIRGNEIAGDLAKKDAERTQVGPEPIFEISQQHVKVWIERNVFQKHSR